MPENLNYSDDPAPSNEQVGVLSWTVGLGLSIIATLTVGKYCFDMPVEVGIVALILAFLFSL